MVSVGGKSLAGELIFLLATVLKVTYFIFISDSNVSRKICQSFRETFFYFHLILRASGASCRLFCHLKEKLE